MFLTCPKCKKKYDPARESSYCARYGHTPVKETEQNLSDALLESSPNKKKKGPDFQSDFRLIWNEPNAND